MRLGRTTRLPAQVTPGEVVLEAREIAAELGGNRILEGVDFLARAGEVVALVGPNGAGKSTLFGVLCGDLAPVNGTVHLFGEPLSRWSTVERALRRGVLPQQLAMSFPFLVRDVVRMGRAPWIASGASDDDEAIVAKAMECADVTQLANRRFTSLSGGERARVAFARILAQQCQVMLLDEPTAALDIHHQETLLEIVRKRAVEGSAVVVVLHDLALAAAYADRIALMSEGSIVGDGPPAEILTDSMLSGVYGHKIHVQREEHTGEIMVIPRRERRGR